jgi:hypothetical protein
MKTWKREIASVLLLTLGVLLWYNHLEALKIVAWPFTTFAGAAFGADWWTKQEKKQ